MSLKQTGILIGMYNCVLSRSYSYCTGPGLNIIFRSFDFNLGAYKVDKYTFPGVRYCITHVLCIVCSYLC